MTMGSAMLCRYATPSCVTCRSSKERRLRHSNLQYLMIFKFTDLRPAICTFGACLSQTVPNSEIRLISANLSQELCLLPWRVAKASRLQWVTFHGGLRNTQPCRTKSLYLYQMSKQIRDWLVSVIRHAWRKSIMKWKGMDWIQVICVISHNPVHWQTNCSCLHVQSICYIHQSSSPWMASFLR